MATAGVKPPFALGGRRISRPSRASSRAGTWRAMVSSPPPRRRRNRPRASVSVPVPWPGRTGHSVGRSGRPTGIRRSGSEVFREGADVVADARQVRISVDRCRQDAALLADRMQPPCRLRNSAYSPPIGLHSLTYNPRRRPVRIAIFRTILRSDDTHPITGTPFLRRSTLPPGAHNNPINYRSPAATSNESVDFDICFI